MPCNPLVERVCNTLQKASERPYGGLKRLGGVRGSYGSIDGLEGLVAPCSVSAFPIKFATTSDCAM